MNKMTYHEAISQAWELLRAIGKSGAAEIEFLGRVFRVDFERSAVSNLAGGAPAKEWHQVLILHYLAREKPVALPEKIEWMSFKELDSGLFYYPSFAERSIDLLARRFCSSPAVAWENAPASLRRRLGMSDFGFSLRVFPKIFVAVLFWKGDGEVRPQYDLLFNREISRIFPTEDVVVLAHGVVETLVHPGDHPAAKEPGSKL